MSVLFSVRALAACVLVLCVAGCHKSEGALEGAFLGLDDELLILIEDDGDVTFKAVLGEGTCVEIGEGELEDGEIVFDDGEPIALETKKDGIVLDDPEDALSGTYRRVEEEAHCYIIAPPPGAMSARAFEVAPGPVRGGSGNSQARTAQITIGAGVGTLAIYLIGQDVGWRNIEPKALRSPDGRALLAEEPYLAECGSTFCTVLLPKIPGFPPVAGTYAFDFGGTGDIEDLRVIAITRPLPIADTTVRLHAVIGPTSHAMSEITDALASVVTFLDGFGITVVLDPVVTSADPAFSAVPMEFLSATTQDLLALGEEDALNVFIVDDIIGIEGLYGIASGISGTLGVVGPWNGVLVNITTHEEDDTSDFGTLLRETIVHELGHLVGLYHTSEASGTLFDPLEDTLECRASVFDSDMDDEVLADECESAGGDNVMFWTPSVVVLPLVPQVELTPDQLTVVDHVVVGN